MQNSQRVLLAKPRTAVASRHGQWRSGAMGTSRPTATGHERGRGQERAGKGVGKGARVRVRAGVRDAKPPRAVQRGRAGNARDESVEMTDCIGRVTTLPVTNGTVRIELTGAPVVLRGLAPLPLH